MCQKKRGEIGHLQEALNWMGWFRVDKQQATSSQLKEKKKVEVD